MTVFRSPAIFRLAILVCALAWLLGMSNVAIAQSGENDSPVDDECFDIGYGTGCDVEGFAAVLAANGQEIDWYVETDIDPLVADDGWAPYVAGDLDQGSSNIDSCENFADTDSGLMETDCGGTDSVVLNNVYYVFGDHGVYDDDGDEVDAGGTEAWVSAIAPTVTSLSPTYAYVGTAGDITLQGSYLLDPFTLGFNAYLTPASGGSTSGMTVTPYAVNSDGTTAEVTYAITQCAGMGGRFINISTAFGSDNGDIVFTVGDPSPNIASVNPGVWQAGTTSLPITVSGSGFGTSPTLTVSGTGVSLVSVQSVSDTQISATVSIAASAPNQTATVQVQSTGYCGSGFQSANNNSSTGSLGVPVQAAPGPAPQIQLYGQTITTTQSVVVGQQMALSATVTLPQGVTITTQQWTTPAGIAVGGYTNATGTLPCLLLTNCPIPDTTGGHSLGLPSQTGSSFTFYWVDSGAGSQDTITYTYLASNGTSNSATATFDIDAPSGITLGTPPGGQMQYSVNVINPPTSLDPINPVLADGASAVLPGINLLASASSLPTGGAYSWVQLLSEDVVKVIASSGPTTCTAVASTGQPVLDNTYPYSSVKTTTVTDDTAVDEPDAHLLTNFGELARSFSATMYPMWTPPALAACPAGNACTVPVPLGAFAWRWTGDSIDTLTTSASVLSTAPNVLLLYPDWFLYASSASNDGFVEDNSYPQWSATFTNGQVNCD